MSDYMRMRREFNLVQKFVVFCVTFLIFGSNVLYTDCQNTDDIRLSTNVRPTNYDIHIKVDVEKRVFEGEETIHVLVYDESTDFIEIHALDLDIENIQVFNNESDAEILVLSTEYSNATEKILLKFNENLEQQQNYRIHVAFKGQLRNDMKGLYISSYYVYDYFLR